MCVPQGGISTESVETGWALMQLATVDIVIFIYVFYIGAEVRTFV